MIEINKIFQVIALNIFFLLGSVFAGVENTSFKCVKSQESKSSGLGGIKTDSGLCEKNNSQKGTFGYVFDGLYHVFNTLKGSVYGLIKYIKQIVIKQKNSKDIEVVCNDNVEAKKTVTIDKNNTIPPELKIQVNNKESENVEDIKDAVIQKNNVDLEKIVDNVEVKKNVNQQTKKITVDNCDAVFPDEQKIVGDKTFTFKTYKQGNIEYYFFMPAFNDSNGRSLLYGYSISKEMPNSKNPLFIYKSLSDGGWRSSLVIQDYQKGNFYSQETKIIPELETIFEKCIDTKLQKDEKKRAEIIKILQSDNMKKIKTDNVVDFFNLSNVRRNILHKIKNWMSFTISYSVESSQNTWPWNDRWPWKVVPPTIELYEAEKEKLSPCFPKIFNNPSLEYELNHSLLGKTIIYAFDQECNGKILRWHLAKNVEGEDLRGWIHQVEIIDSSLLHTKSNLNGSYDNVVGLDLLAVKPVEYMSQFWGDDFETFKAFFKDDKIQKKRVGNNYYDVSSITSHFSPVKEFLESFSTKTN